MNTLVDFLYVSFDPSAPNQEEVQRELCSYLETNQETAMRELIAIIEDPKYDNLLKCLSIIEMRVIIRKIDENFDAKLFSHCFQLIYSLFSNENEDIQRHAANSFSAFALYLISNHQSEEQILNDLISNLSSTLYPSLIVLQELSIYKKLEIKSKNIIFDLVIQIVKMDGMQHNIMSICFNIAFNLVKYLNYFENGELFINILTNLTSQGIYKNHCFKIWTRIASKFPGLISEELVIISCNNPINVFILTFWLQITEEPVFLAVIDEILPNLLIYLSQHAFDGEDDEPLSSKVAILAILEKLSIGDKLDLQYLAIYVNENIISPNEGLCFSAAFVFYLMQIDEENILDIVLSHSNAKIVEIGLLILSRSCSNNEKYFHLIIPFLLNEILALQAASALMEMSKDSEEAKTYLVNDIFLKINEELSDYHRSILIDLLRALIQVEDFQRCFELAQALFANNPNSLSLVSCCEILLKIMKSSSQIIIENFESLYLFLNQLLDTGSSDSALKSIGVLAKATKEFFLPYVSETMIHILDHLETNQFEHVQAGMCAFVSISQSLFITEQLKQWMPRLTKIFFDALSAQEQSIEYQLTIFRVFEMLINFHYDCMIEYINQLCEVITVATQSLFQIDEYNIAKDLAIVLYRCLTAITKKNVVGYWPELKQSIELLLVFFGNSIDLSQLKRNEIGILISFLYFIAGNNETQQTFNYQMMIPFFEQTIEFIDKNSELYHIITTNSLHS